MFPLPRATPAGAEQAPQNESSDSLNPAALVPGELFPSDQTGNSFPSCVCALQTSWQPNMLLEPGWELLGSLRDSESRQILGC